MCDAIWASHFSLRSIVLYLRMRQVGLWIILISFLFGHVNLIEVTKLPRLVSHFIIHQDESPDLGFLEFIHAHYCHEHFHCHEQQSEHNLPFQSCDFHVVHLIAQSSNLVLVEGRWIDAEIEHTCSYRTPAMGTLAIDIWQPPKL